MKYSMAISLHSNGRLKALFCLQQSWSPLTFLMASWKQQTNQLRKARHAELGPMALMSNRNFPRTQSMQVEYAQFSVFSSSFLRFCQYSLMSLRKVCFGSLLSGVYLSPLRFKSLGKYFVRNSCNILRLLMSSQLYSTFSFSEWDFSSLYTTVFVFDRTICWSLVGRPGCFVLIWVYRAGQLRQAFPHSHTKFRSVRSFLPFLFLIFFSSKLSLDMLQNYAILWQFSQKGG